MQGLAGTQRPPARWHLPSRSRSPELGARLRGGPQEASAPMAGQEAARPPYLERSYCSMDSGSVTRHSSGSSGQA